MSTAVPAQDILSVIGGDTQLKWVSHTRGGEYHGPCPFCGGSKRFRLQPEQGLWHCRDCSPNEHWNDLPAYLMQRDGLSYPQALDKLGLKDAGQPREHTTPVPKAPDPTWQKAAEVAVAQAQEALWSPQGALAQNWLKEVRLLTNATIEAASLGYIPKGGRAFTGIVGGKIQSIDVPRGILIPRRAVDGTLWGLKVATGIDDSARKYRFVSGSQAALCGVNTGKDYAIITEGEFDMLVALQACGERADVFTFGSNASRELVQAWADKLGTRTRILLAADQDEAGDRMERTWGGFGTRRLVLPALRGEKVKDVTDFARKGGSFAAVVSAAIALEDLRCAVAAKLEGVPAKGLVGFQEDPPRVAAPTRSTKEAVPPPAEQAPSRNEDEYDAPYRLYEEDADLFDLCLTLSQYGGVIALDTETTGLSALSDTLLLIQFGIPGVNYFVDARKVNVKLLANLLTTKKFVLQNAKFDCHFLLANVGVTPNVAWDTQLAEQILHAGEPKSSYSASLKSLCKHYLGYEMDKGVRSSFIGQKGPLTEEQLRYAGTDCQVLFPIMALQAAAIHEAGMDKVAQCEHLLVPALAAMEQAGVGVDVAKWRAYLAQVTQERDRRAAVAGEALGLTGQGSLFGGLVFNLDSNDEVRKALHTLGVEVEDTADATLAKVKHPAAEAVRAYRDQAKTLSSFGESVLKKIHPKTGRIHADYRQHGTDTGRLSCTSPNLQQVPRTSSLRSCIVPAPGNVLVVADYSQIELRILAHLSGDEAMKAAFVSGLDLHQATAATMFGVPFEQVTKEQRYAAKSIGFGLVYGRGAAALADQLGVSEAEGKKLMADYFSAYRKVDTWIKEQGNKSIREGESRTLLNRRRKLQVPMAGAPGWQRDIGGVRRQGVNSPVQGSSGDMTKLAMAALYRRLPEGAFLVLSVHDEIVVECPEGIAEETKAVLEKEMVKAGEYLIPTVPVVVEGKIAACWEK